MTTTNLGQVLEQQSDLFSHVLLILGKFSLKSQLVHESDSISTVTKYQNIYISEGNVKNW